MDNEKVVPKEGDLYRTFSIHGKPFTLYYGFYDEKDREFYRNEPMPIYPDLREYPQYTDDGIPIVTRMQIACRYYKGDLGADNGCFTCKHFEHCEEFFGVCRCHANQKGHLISVVADRLGCKREALQRPENRERVLNELKTGDTEKYTAKEMQELIAYIAPPMKVLLYGTEEDKAVLLEWQFGENYFSDIVVCESYSDYVEALKDSTYEIIICMLNGNNGTKALKAAYEQCQDKPMMWFPQTTEDAFLSYQYGCVFAAQQRQMNLASLTFGVELCREKMRKNED